MFIKIDGKLRQLSDMLDTYKDIHPVVEKYERLYRIEDLKDLDIGELEFLKYFTHFKNKYLNLLWEVNTLRISADCDYKEKRLVKLDDKLGKVISEFNEMISIELWQETRDLEPTVDLMAHN